jgi:hypothetical protein
MHLLDGTLLALAALALYACLAQEVTYGDGDQLLNYMLGGNLTYWTHFFYLPLLAGAHAVLGEFGFTLHDSGVAFSAAGTALGVFGAHAGASRLGLSRGAALLVGILVATAPAVLFFATVVEVHGPFFAFAGLSFVCTARFVASPGVARGAELGAVTGLAVGAHATGNLLPCLLLPFAGVLARECEHRPEMPALSPI